MFTPASIAALIIASSFAAGLNIYATVLTLGILARTHLVHLPPGLDPLGLTWFATHHPLIAATIAIVLLVAAAAAARALLRAIHRPLKKIFRPDLIEPDAKKPGLNP